MLSPGERCRAEAINVLQPGNTGGGNRGNTTTGTKVTAKYCHRGNIIGGSHRVLLPGNVGDGSKGSAATGTKIIGKCYYREIVVKRKP